MAEVLLKPFCHRTHIPVARMSNRCNATPGLPGLSSTIFPDFPKILYMTTTLDCRILNEFGFS